MSANLSANQKHLLRLIKIGIGHDGWSKVSKPIWKFIRELPSELVELAPSDNEEYYARLTREGEIIVKWMCS